jgi:ferredoxin
MPKLTVHGETSNYEEGQRLVLAIEDMGIEIGHRCGGKARCTTCRVEFVSGEPAEMTKAEFDKLSAANLLGQVRLSCQIVLNQDMEVKPLMTKETEGWPDTGPVPNEQVEPEATWLSRAELERGA